MFPNIQYKIINIMEGHLSLLRKKFIWSKSEIGGAKVSPEPSCYCRKTTVRYFWIVPEFFETAIPCHIIKAFCKNTNLFRASLMLYSLLESSNLFLEWKTKRGLRLSLVVGLNAAFQVFGQGLNCIPIRCTQKIKWLKVTTLIFFFLVV